MSESFAVEPRRVADNGMTPGDRSRQVLGRLGAPVDRYAISWGAPDWDEVVARYGERFRGAQLLRLEGSFDYDDSSYYSYGEQWILAAADVTDPPRTIADCFMEEAAADPRSHLDGYKPTFGGYASSCDRSLLFSRGIVLVDFVRPVEKPQPSLEDTLTEAEHERLETLAGQVWPPVDDV